MVVTMHRKNHLSRLKQFREFLVEVWAKVFFLTDLLDVGTFQPPWSFPGYLEQMLGPKY